MTPDAKGLFSEHHPSYMGTYWGSVSSVHVAEIVESADLLLFVGPIFNDYTTTGWTTLISPSKLILIGDNSVSVKGRVYTHVHLRDVLAKLALKVPKLVDSLQNFNRYKIHSVPMKIENSDNELCLVEFRNQVQQYLTPTSALLVETGDCWFIGQQLVLPDGAKFHVQMQYGSIGWSVGK